jgi:hypothetical protein
MYGSEGVKERGLTIEGDRKPSDSLANRGAVLRAFMHPAIFSHHLTRYNQTLNL